MFEKDLLVCLQVKSSRDYKYLELCNKISNTRAKIFPYLSPLSAYAAGDRISHDCYTWYQETRLIPTPLLWLN